MLPGYNAVIEKSTPTIETFEENLSTFSKFAVLVFTLPSMQNFPKNIWNFTCRVSPNKYQVHISCSGCYEKLVDIVHQFKVDSKSRKFLFGSHND